MIQQQPTQMELLAGLKRSATIIQSLQKELQGYHEPIAIVGMGCRFPGEANTPAAYWELLRAGISAVSEAPLHRGQPNAGNGVGNTLDRPSTYYGHYLRAVGYFDAGFFGISPREAQWMDPQQQLLLEVAIEALEQANLPVDGLLGSRTGVYVGLMNQDYANTLQSGELDVYTATGSEASFLAGRLSYLLGLRGPSMIVGTACSSSLVTTHLACQALRTKECDVALSGGVSLILRPESNAMLTKMQATAPDGLSKTFDATADGFGRGEGCGVLVLKRLTDAQRDGDRVWALIRGSAVNHDGRSGGLTVPSGPAQEELLRRALAATQVDANQITYVEAHGTGTALGDPIEIQALGNVLCQDRQTPLLIGSVKTNIGHLEPAAGVAGLMKVILALQHKQIPPHLHFHTPNPHIPWDAYPLQVPTTLTEWQADGPRLAGVSAFGLSGINAHVILEEAPAQPHATDQTDRLCYLLTLSAKNEAALRELAKRYVAFLADVAPIELGDVCYTSHVGRTVFDYRLAVAGPTPDALQQHLAAYLAERDGSETIVKQRNEKLKIAFLFTGQGAQSVGMGRELYQTSPTFRATIDRCEALFQQETGASLLAILYPEQKSAVRSQQSEVSSEATQPQEPSKSQNPKSKIDETTYTQPALFVLEYALATLWQSWGIQPNLLMGHSIGELAAACVAGVFNLEDGLKLVVARGRLMGALPQDGEMVSLLTSEKRVRQAIVPYANQVSIGAVNGPENIVIAGRREAVLTIADQFNAEGVKTRQLTVSHAFHSPLMEPMLDDFRKVAQSITYHKPKLRLVSNVTGKLAGDEIMTPDYWVRHVRETVRFADGIQTLHEQGANLFLEIGPKPVLLGMVEQTDDKMTNSTTGHPIMLPSLRDSQRDWQQMLTSLGTLYVHGVAIDWIGFEEGCQRCKVTLPTYPFQRRRYWVSPSAQPQTQLEQMANPQPATPLLAYLQAGNVQALAALLANKLSPAEQAVLPTILARLTKEQQRQATLATIQDWFYTVAWRLQSLPPVGLPDAGVRENAATSAEKTWLILADATGVGEALAQLLRQRECQPIIVTQGETYQQVSAYQAEINPRRAADYQQLLATFPHVQQVVSLWSLDAPTLAAVDEVTAAALEAAVELSCGSVLHLVQALVKADRSLRGLWLVTQDTQAVLAADGVTGVAQSPLWGLGRVLAREHSESHPILLDLERKAMPEADRQTVAGQQAAQLLAELLTDHTSAGNEFQIALRQGQRYVARFERAALPPTRLTEQGVIAQSSSVVIKPDATYLITGGMGGLGNAIAHWLVEQGAQHLLLMGRRRPKPAVQTQLDEWVAQGVTVTIVQGDVSHQADVAAALAQIAPQFPLRGIVHAAGVLADGILPNQTWARFTEVLLPKAWGAWHLHTLTHQQQPEATPCASPQPLDFFVLFSSIAGVLGNPGQANYAAANTFLDGLAHYRRGQGLPALSINWSAWSEVGLAADLGQNRLASAGIGVITPDQGVAAFARSLTLDSAQVTVLPVKWPLFHTNAGANQPLFAELRKDIAAYESAIDESPAAAFTPVDSQAILPQLAQTPVAERSAFLTSYLCQLVAGILRLPNANAVDPAENLLALGFDSLMAVELRNHVRHTWRVNIDAARFLAGLSVAELTAELLTQADLAQNALDFANVTVGFAVNGDEESAVVPSGSAATKDESFVNQNLEDEEAWITI